MLILYVATGLAFLISLIANRARTIKAIRISARLLVKITPPFLMMLILVSLVLYLIPDRIILHYLGGSNTCLSMILACFFGSLTLMPGFVAFPLCGILIQKGVGYMVIAAFTTTLMMVGILTYPIEKAYFGIKLTIIRNIICLISALIVALCIGLFFGEIG